MGNDLIPYSSWLSRGATILRHLKLGRKVLTATREAACYSTLKRFHIDVLHRMRQISSLVPDLTSDLEEPSLIAQEVCTECRRVLGTLLEIHPNHLHCCIKVFVDPATDGGSVATWVRSDPVDDRPPEMGRTKAHRVRENTVWAALLGDTDGNWPWRQHRVFGCNDLTNHRGQFKCTREHWDRYYKATLAVPIRFPTNHQKNEYDVIGFLTFDSPKPGVFRKVPNIFDYMDQSPAEYGQALESCMAFHATGILADTLGAFLHIIKNRSNEAGS